MDDRPETMVTRLKVDGISSILFPQTMLKRFDICAKMRMVCPVTYVAGHYTVRGRGTIWPAQFHMRTARRSGRASLYHSHILRGKLNE